MLAAVVKVMNLLLLPRCFDFYDIYNIYDIYVFVELLVNYIKLFKMTMNNFNSLLKETFHTYGEEIYIYNGI